MRAGPVSNVERRREGAGAGEVAALGTMTERGERRCWPLLPPRFGGVGSIRLVFPQVHVKMGLGCNELLFFFPSGPALAVQAPACLPEPVGDTRESNEAPSFLDSILWMAAPKKRRTIEVNRCRRRNPNKLIKVKVITKFPRACRRIHCK